MLQYSTHFLFLTGMFLWTSCSLDQNQGQPCPAIMIQPGVRLKVLDKNGHQNLIAKSDSFEIRNATEPILFIPDIQDSSIFVALNGNPVEEFYFRIKPRTTFDTILVHARTYEKQDDPCKTPVYEIDSMFHNGSKLNSTNLYY